MPRLRLRTARSDRTASAATCAAAAVQRDPEERRAEWQVADGEEPDHVQHGVEHRQAELAAEQDETDDRPEEPGDEHPDANTEPALEREPEPRVQRRKHEHEGVRLEERKADGHEPEQRQRDDESRQALVASGHRDGHERPADDQPRERECADENEHAEERRRLEELRVRRQRQGLARGEDPRERTDPDEERPEGPDPETRPLRPDRRREREATTPATHDEVDDAEREGDDRQDEREPRGPAARRAIGEEQAVGSPKRSADAPVEGAHERLRGSPQLSEALAARRRPADALTVRGHGERGQSAGEEAALLVLCERHAEIHELRRQRRQGRARHRPPP